MTALSSPRPLRLLIAEDSPVDAELMVATLKRAGYSLFFDLVDSLETFRQHLEQNRYDLILSDHNLRTWTGMEGLEALKQMGKDVPFVVATATLGDEAAVEYIKHGATEYVLKHRMDRLPAAVGRALREKAYREETARLQETILEAKREWELTFDTVPSPVLVLDENCRIRRANRAAASLLGLNFSQMIGQPCYTALHGLAEPPDCPHHRLMQTGMETAGDMEEPRLGKTFAVTSTPLRDPSGGLRGCVHVMVDITERKRSEKALRESEERFRRLVEISPDAIYVQREGRIAFINPAGLRLLGAAGANEIVGMPVLDFIHPDYHGRVQQRIRDSAQQGEVAEPLEEQFLRLDGTAVDVEVMACPFKWQDQPAVQVMVRDISERKRAERALRESEQRYRLLFESSPQPMWVYDLETMRFLAVNEAAVAHYGYARGEFLAMMTADIRAPEQVPALPDGVERSGNGLEKSLSRHRKKDGTIITVEVASHPLDFGDRPARIVLATDVTERHLLEQQLQQAAKMEAVGRLAGGLAHDFNNLLGIMMGHAQLLQEQSVGDEKVQRRAREIIKAGGRAADLSRQLLTFSRKQLIAPAVLDLNQVVADVASMLQRLLGEDIELAAVAGKPLARIRADRGQLEQILVNLAVNARDAMPKGGKLSLETRNVTLDDNYARRHLGAKPGSHVLLAVSDNGCGMPSEVQAHIFEPFFTTKEAGKGTGLGLATVYALVEQNGGHIWVYSELGKGTTFKIYLPSAEGVAETASNPAPAETPCRGTETVLLAEDEEGFRSITREILSEQGYTVLEAENGASAMEVLREHADAIDLLVTDVVMPGMSGADLAQRVRELCPHIRVLFVSGYTDDAIARHGIMEKGTAFLEKPFTPADLARKVREVLAAGE